MSETIHPAQVLREAEIELKIAGQLSADLAQAHQPWQKLSPRRCAALSGILSLLTDADKKYRAAGTDPRSPLPAAIRDLHTKTSGQLRSVLAMYGLFVATAALLLGAVGCLVLGVIPRDDSPVITEPKEDELVDMTIPVSGPSPSRFLIPGTHLYVLVKPQDLDYWLQPLPKVNSTGWKVEDAGIGQEDDHGMRFHICAILTWKTLPDGWHGAVLPAELSRCINVTRK